MANDAWLVAMQWQQTPYPLFKRLALFAATQSNVVPSADAVEWLLDSDGWWLWSVETQREALRFLVVRGYALDRRDAGRLEDTIMSGPPRDMFKEDIDATEWARLVDHQVWLRLSKLRAGGAILGESAQAELDRLSRVYPEVELAADGSDEFPFWMGAGDDLRTFLATPRAPRDLIEWLKEHPDRDPWQDDDWQQRCRDEFRLTACVLCKLAQDNQWPVDRWHEALQAWADETLLLRSWRYIAPVLEDAPDAVLASLAHSVGSWLRSLASSFERQEDSFFGLCSRLLQLDFADVVDDDDFVTRAINHPVGDVAEALLRWWFRRDLQDKQGVPDEVAPFLESFTSAQHEEYRYARVILARHVFVLFRLDPEWMGRRFLPWFDWDVSPVDAASVWQGFLVAPRLYVPLIEALKGPFLATAGFYQDLGDLRRQYAALLTFAALEASGAFTLEQLKTALTNLPDDGREEVVGTLVRALEGAGNQRSQYWRNRVRWFWKHIWPQSMEYRKPELSDDIARLCVVALDEFPDALTVLRAWLQTIEQPDFVVSLLRQNELPKRFPRESLAFLDIIVGPQCDWPPGDLMDALTDIASEVPRLRTDARYRRLYELCRIRGEA